MVKEDNALMSILPFWFSMTTIADLNDKWAAYAGPGGWNGRNTILLYAFDQDLVTNSNE